MPFSVFFKAGPLWVEEVHRLSEESAKILIPTITRFGAEIWFTWNPKHRTDWVWQRFVVHPRDNNIILKFNWRDNPWFPEYAEGERAALRERTVCSRGQTNKDYFQRRHAQMAWALRLRAQATARLMRGEPVDKARCLFINRRSRGWTTTWRN